VPLDAPVLAAARVLVGKYPLRALDAIQLACAQWEVRLLKEPMTFDCADNRLLSAAAGGECQRRWTWVCIPSASSEQVIGKKAIGYDQVS
jgi:hypothetical protein